MSRNLLMAATAAALLSIAGAADAAVFVFSAPLTGASEVPPVATSATGNVLVTIDDALDTMSVDADFTGLAAPAFAAHIHCCAPLGTNAGVATGMPGFPAATSGTYSHTFNLLDSSIYSGAFLTANGGTAAGAYAALFANLKAGETYFNVHNATWPGGEIRGQLSYVPEPGTWALMIAGFGLAGVALRRRARPLPA